MDFTRAQVFIHGGGYAYGGAHDTELDGRNLAMVADVVVVTVQVGVPERGGGGGWALSPLRAATACSHRRHVLPAFAFLASALDPLFGPFPPSLSLPLLPSLARS